MSALLETREELLDQHKEYTRELAAFTRERDEERVSPTQDDPGVPVGTTTSSPPDPVEGRGADGGGEIGQAPEGEITWPVRSSPSTIGNCANWVKAITFPLHVGSYLGDFRRDTADWKNMNRDGWTERLVFNVFKFEELGTFKVNVQITTATGANQILVNREPHPMNRWVNLGWKNLLHFYAYSEQRPGTHAISVAYHSEPERSIFLKGDPIDRVDTLPGWERTLQFWVPK